MIKKSMTGLFLVGLISASLFLTSACQKQPPAPTGPTEEEIAEQKRMEDEARRKAEEEARLAEEARRKAEEERIRMEEERAAMEAEAAKAAMAEQIYFDYDSSELKPAAQDILTKKAAWLEANGGYKIKIEGHCDERGSTEYNLALGSRRAEAAAKFLNALGISSDRITTVSYGEEKPAVEGKGESAWSKNRRDEFKLMQ